MIDPRIPALILACTATARKKNLLVNGFSMLLIATLIYPNPAPDKFSPADSLNRRGPLLNSITFPSYL